MVRVAHTRYSKCWITKQNSNLCHAYLIMICTHSTWILLIFFFFFFWSCMKQRIIKTIKAVRSFQVNILLALISYTMEFRIISACYDFCVEPRGFWSVLLLCSSSLCHDQILHIFHKVKPICCRTCFCLW